MPRWPGSEGDSSAEQQERSQVTFFSASDHEERLKELREGKGTASAEANYTEPLLGKIEDLFPPNSLFLFPPALHQG